MAAKIFYVDPINGQDGTGGHDGTTPALAWQTIQWAVDHHGAIDAGTITVNFRQGTYNITTPILMGVQSGTSSYRIIYKGDYQGLIPGWEAGAVTIKHLSSSFYSFKVLVNYITFNGFTFIGPNITQCFSLGQYSPSIPTNNNIIEYCNVDGATHFVYNMIDNSTGNIIRYNNISNTTDTAIYHYLKPGGLTLSITNNVITNFGSTTGIWIYGGAGSGTLTITNNVINSGGAGSSLVRIWQGTSGYIFTSDYNTLIKGTASYVYRTQLGDFTTLQTWQTASGQDAHSADSFIPPIAPTGFVGTVLSDTSIRWDWVDASSDEIGFYVQDDSVPPINKSPVLPPGTQTWTETGLTQKTLYTRHANVFNSYGSTNSNSDSKTTFGQTFYVDFLAGDDNYDGLFPVYTSGIHGPWATPQHASDTANPANGTPIVVWMKPGTPLICAGGVWNINKYSGIDWSNRIIFKGDRNGAIWGVSGYPILLHSGIRNSGMGYISIQGFEITGVTLYGIIFVNTRAGAIDGNYIHDLSAADKVTGITVGKNIAVTVDVTIRNNIIKNLVPTGSTRTAIGMDLGFSYTNVFNNTIYNIQGSATDLDLFLWGGFGIKIAHSDGDPNSYSYTDMQNNIIQNVSGVRIVMSAPNTTINNAVLISDYNNLYEDGVSYCGGIRYSTTTYLYLYGSNWRAEPHFLPDQHSWGGDSKFTNPSSSNSSGMKITHTSTCIGVASAHIAYMHVGDDHFGRPRLIGSDDIGAHQYSEIEIV